MNDESGAPPPAQTKRRFLDRAPTAPMAPTVIGAGAVVVGNLRGAGPFVISGEVEGDGDLDGSLYITASGVWNGNIRAAQALVAGKVFGSLRVGGKLEIGRTAVIRGSVSAGRLAIAKGAVVEASVAVTAGEPVVRFEEKRGT